MSNNIRPFNYLEIIEFTNLYNQLPIDIRGYVHPPDSVRLYWDSGLPSSVLGSYKWHKKSIFMNPMFIGLEKMAIGTLCHELHHSYQHSKLGSVKFALYSIPVIRRFMLEESAWKIEKAVDKFFGNESLNSENPGWFV